MSVQQINVADAGAVGVTLAAIAGWLPSISALLSIIWLALRIWESDTVQKLFGKRGRRTDDGK